MSHIYTFGGVTYPSVTTILQRTKTREEATALRLWRRKFNMVGFKNAEDYVEYSAIRGTFVHYNILNSLYFSVLDPSGLPPTTKWWHRREPLIREIEHCRKLWDESGIEKILKGSLTIETPMYHPQMRYAGTPDLLVVESGLLIDLKTSSTPREDHKTQLGGYTQMIEYHKLCHIRKAMLVYLNPGKQRVVIVDVGREELNNEIDIFNEKIREFWNLPGIKIEYGL